MPGNSDSAPNQQQQQHPHSTKRSADQIQLEPSKSQNHSTTNHESKIGCAATHAHSNVNDGGSPQTIKRMKLESPQGGGGVDANPSTTSSKSNATKSVPNVTVIVSGQRHEREMGTSDEEDEEMEEEGGERKQVEGEKCPVMDANSMPLHEALGAGGNGLIAGDDHDDHHHDSHMTKHQDMDAAKEHGHNKDDDTPAMVEDSGGTSKPLIGARGRMIVGSSGDGAGQVARWRAHRMAEDYIHLAGNMMLPGIHLAPFGYDAPSGQYPIECITALGILTSPLRRPTVVEKWSPYEIAVFEASLALCGKQFHEVQKFVKTKNTKEIIEFYYIWKKTSHYKVWKRQYVLSEDDVDSDDD